MIPIFWTKKIVAIVTLHQNDVADWVSPLPLFMQLSWNHYIGLYYQEIQNFFSAWLPYPIDKEQFIINLNQNNKQLDGSEIISNLVGLYKVGIQKPLQLTCRFRSSRIQPQIQYKKLYKQNLKSSTCIRNGRFGASILTVQMSIKNVQKMYQNFINNDLTSYLGSENFQSEDLGFKFVISKSQKIPVRIIGRNVFIQRGVPKKLSLGQFLAEILNQKISKYNKSKQQMQITQLKSQQASQDVTVQQNQNKETPNLQTGQQLDPKSYNFLFKKYEISLHCIKLSRGEYSLQFFQRFCHPDGFLYLTLSL